MARYLIPPWLTLLGLFSLSACERPDGDTVCEGRVVDRTTGALVLQPVTVGVYHTGNSSTGGGYSLREEHQTDANGRFSFHINSDANDLALRAYGAPGYSTWWQEAPDLRGGHNNKGLNLKVQSPAWIKFRIRLPDPADTAAIQLWGGVDENLWVFGSATVTSLVSANSNLQVNWIIQPLGRPRFTGTLSRFCPALDTVLVEISY